MQEDEDTLAAREHTLNHAYGFISHGNREAGLTHIETYLADSEDELGARLWFFSQLAEWENEIAALEFGAALIEHLLAAGDTMRARKVLLRCRHLSEEFSISPETEAVLELNEA